MSKNLIKEKLNKFGSIKEPFLFVLSYDLSKFYIQKLSSLPKNIKFQIDSQVNVELKRKINSYKTKKN